MQTASVTPAAASAPGPGRLLATPLYTNAFYLWGNMLVIVVAGFVFWALVAALYDAREVGLGAAAVSALSLIALLSTFGLGMGLVSLLPLSGERAPVLINSSFALAGLSSAVLSAIFLAGLRVWSPELLFLREQPHYVLGFVLFSVLLTLTYLQDQAFVSARGASYVFAKTLLFQTARTILPAALVALAAFGIVASMGLAAAVGFLFGMVVLRRLWPAYRPALALARRPLRQMLPPSLANHIADLSIVMPSLILPIMVVHVLDAESGAYFFAGWFLSQVFAGISIYAALSLFAEASRQKEGLPALTAHALILALLATAAVAVPMTAFADRLLLAFGRDYSAQATDLLRLVAIASLPAALTNVYLGVERARGGYAWLVTTPVLTAAVTLGASYLLLPGMGITGAGVGLLAGQGLGAAIAAVRLPRGLRSAADDIKPPALRPPEDLSDDDPGAEASASPNWPHREMPAVSVVVCALNERESLPHILPRIPEWVHEVLLVDGHSVDGTPDVARLLRPDIRVLRQPGRGKGDAMRFGIAQASGEIVVTLDADGETDPRELPRFLDPLLKGCDFAKGSRFAYGKARKPLARRLGNRVIAAVCNLLFGTRFTDLCSGYNAFWKRVTDRVNLWADDDWNYEPSIIARALRAGLTVVEVPHSHSGRINGRSKLSNFRQGFNAIKALLRERFRG